MLHARLARSLAVAGAAALTLGLTMAQASAFSASFRWCPGSPAFTLKGVPPGTAALDFHMTDLNVPSFPHGGGKVAYGGQDSVPCGAFASGFTGPSPPPGEVHTYEFTVKALSAGGATLATAKARRKFPE